MKRYLFFLSVIFIFTSCNNNELDLVGPLNEKISENSLEVDCATRSIKGRVVDAGTNTPLSGVLVKVNYSLLGTLTDANGYYELNVPTNLTKITISFVGYVTQELNFHSASCSVYNNVQLVSE